MRHKVERAGQDFAEQRSDKFGKRAFDRAIDEMPVFPKGLALELDIEPVGGAEMAQYARADFFAGDQFFDCHGHLALSP